MSRPGPPAGVAEALEVLSRAFASRDVEAALACFADDDSVVYSGSEVGEVAAGRNELRSLFAALFERESAYSWDVTELWSSSRGDLAFVTAEAVGHSHNTEASEDYAYRLTGVLSCGPDGCRWLQLHGAEPTASDD